MSLAEQFTEHYLKDREDIHNDWINQADAKLLIKILSLNDGSTGFILTKNQFEHLRNILFKYSLQDCGLYKFQVHPKSGHILHTGYTGEHFVYPTKGLSKDFKYYRWSFNGLFCKDWVYFYELIQNIRCEYVAIKQNGDGDFFCAFDMDKKVHYEMQTHVGGGRLYHEPSAQAYEPTSYDIVIE